MFKKIFKLLEIPKKAEELGGKINWIFQKVFEIERRLYRAERDIGRIETAMKKADIKVGSGKGRYWDKTQ